jgi:hypothetical protein
MVEVGYVRMAVHERVVPVRVLMSPDRQVRMDVLVVGDRSPCQARPVTPRI